MPERNRQFSVVVGMTSSVASLSSGTTRDSLVRDSGKMSGQENSENRLHYHDAIPKTRLAIVCLLGYGYVVSNGNFFFIYTSSTLRNKKSDCHVLFLWRIMSGRIDGALAHFIDITVTKYQPVHSMNIQKSIQQIKWK